MNLIAGSQFYKYTLNSKLGNGAFGEVWLAKDETLAKQFAIKILDASEVSIANCLNESQIGHQMDHGNLVKVHSADIIDGKFIIVMDYLPNGPVTNVLNSGNFLPIKKAIHCMVDVLRGLEFLHEKNIFHNDIKPGNIMVGNGGAFKLTDYGISARTGGQTSVQCMGAYKLHAAPETIANSAINIQSDIYQCGLTLFRLVNGIGDIANKFHSHGEDNFYTMVQQGNLLKDSDYQVHFPTSLKKIITKSINPTPSQRYQSALDMRRALERLSFFGEWTFNENGLLAGSCDNYLYSFDEVLKNGRLVDFTGHKIHKNTGKKTRVLHFCGKNLRKEAAQAMKKKFVQGVLSGQL